MPDNGEIKVTVIENHWDLLPQYLDQLREREGQGAVDRTVAALWDATVPDETAASGSKTAPNPV